MVTNSNESGNTGKHYGTRRIISLLLAITMVFSLIPSNLLAAADAPDSGSGYVMEEDTNEEGLVAEPAADDDGDIDEPEGTQEEAIIEGEPVTVPEPVDEAKGENGDTDINEEDIIIEENPVDTDEDGADKAPVKEPGADLGDEINQDVLEEEGFVFPFDDVDGIEVFDDEFLMAHLEELIFADAVPGLVSYYIEDNLYMVEFVPDGQRAKYPGIPPKAYFPEGYVSFEGWFTETGTTPYDFDTIVIGGEVLHAHFSKQYLVSFLNGSADDHVFKSYRVDQGGVATPPTPLEVENMFKGNDKIFDFWTADLVTKVAYNFATVLTDDLKLYPVFADRVFIYFITFSDELNPYPDGIKAGSTIQMPATPTRDKYMFNYWSTSPTGTPPYVFGQPVYSDLVLYASWTGVPNSATYKVVYWLEEPNLTVVPSPGNPNHYMYADIVENLKGTPGEEVYISNLSLLKPAADRDVTDPMRYAEFQYSSPTIISAADNTIINVYLKRKEYTFTFDLGTNSANNFRFKTGGQTYSNANPYQFIVKYQQNCSDIWPCSATADFNFKFYAWEPPVTTVIGSQGKSQYFLTRRNVV